MKDYSQHTRFYLWVVLATLNSQVVFWDFHRVFIISLAHSMLLVCGELKIMGGSPMSWTKDAAFSDFKGLSLVGDRSLWSKAMEGLWILL